MDEVPKPAGWYADPERPGELRYWTGAMWGSQWKGTRAGDGAPAQLGRGFHALGAVVSVGLQLSVPLLLGQLALYLWGASMIDEAAAVGDVEKLTRYDDIDRALSISFAALLLVTGIAWMVWQYRLAKSVKPSDLRRGPGWHAWAWVVPVVNFWFPFQNVSDLWKRRFGDRRMALLGWWWGGWIATLILDRVYARLDLKTLDDIHTAINVGIASSIVGVVTVVMAIIIQRALTKAEAPGAISSGASPAA